MIAKMKSCAAKKDFRKALVIGQNLFARNRGDMEIFKAYASVLESIIEAENSADEKIRYFQQLSSVLTVFSESADMNDSVVDFVISYEDKLKNLYIEIVKTKVQANNDILSNISAAVEKLKNVSDRSAFDSLLKQVQAYDDSISKAYLTDSQKVRYDSMTQQCSKIVDMKLRAFQRAADVEYNNQALAAYEKVFQIFRSGNLPENHEEVVKGLFGFDAGRLFNETLTYYNHVYAYILSKLDDNGKFVLTKAAIYSEVRR